MTKETPARNRRRAAPALVGKLPDDFLEAAAANDAEVSAIPGAPADGQAAEAPPRPCPAVMLIYKFIRNDGSSGTSRFFFEGAYDVRTKGDIAALENALMKNFEGQYASVMIVNWRSLEG